ncbi:putative DD41D transposase [Trichonephila clavipes]|nr:putative DD41D transposase [Trichonephila clavipes]
MSKTGKVKSRTGQLRMEFLGKSRSTFGCPAIEEGRIGSDDVNKKNNAAPVPHDIRNEEHHERFVEWAQNEIAVVPDFHKRILFSDEAHFWLNGYVNKQNCRFWSEANPQVYVEAPLHPEKLNVWCALWASGILLQKR